MNQENETHLDLTSDVMRLVELAQWQERQACAKIAEHHVECHKLAHGHVHDCAQEIAEEIRDRGENR